MSSNSTRPHGEVELRDAPPPQGYVDYFSVAWEASMVPHLAVHIGEARSQTFWEFLALFLVLEVWADEYRSSGLNVAGDNVGALQQALALKGRGPMLEISREVAWRKARRGWSFKMGHLPSERNGTADALSRMAAPELYPLPRCLRGLPRRSVPDVSKLWLARSDASV